MLGTSGKKRREEKETKNRKTITQVHGSSLVFFNFNFKNYNECLRLTAFGKIKKKEKQDAKDFILYSNLIFSSEK